MHEAGEAPRTLLALIFDWGGIMYVFYLWLPHVYYYPCKGTPKGHTMTWVPMITSHSVLSSDIWVWDVASEVVAKWEWSLDRGYQISIPHQSILYTVLFNESWHLQLQVRSRSDPYSKYFSWGLNVHWFHHSHHWWNLTPNVISSVIIYLLNIYHT